MVEETVIDTDVLIVGGGFSSFFAAIKARELGAGVTIVEKAYASKSGGAAFAGGHIAVFNPEWGHDIDTWMDFIVNTGEYVNNRDWIEIVLKDSYARYRDLISWDIPFLETAESVHTGNIVAGSSNYALLFAGQFMPRLREKVLETGAKILDRIMVTDLLKQENRVVGAVAFDTREGDFYIFKAKATLVATGASSFKAAGNSMYWATADGEAMSYRAGAEIMSKEFGGKDVATVKDFPAAGKAIRGPHSHYVNAEDEDFSSRYAPKFNEMNRLMLSALFEVHAGRGPIFLDFNALTREEMKSMVEDMKRRGHLKMVEKVGFDLNKTGKIEVIWGGRVGHSSEGFGGVVIDTNCQSNLPGLFCAGDCAATMMSGSCYAPTGYGLGIAAVTGYRAGKSVAKFALEANQPVIDEEEAAKLKEVVYAPLSRKGGFSPGYLTEMLRNVMLPYYVMQIKHGERLQAALTFVQFLGNHLGSKLKADDAHELRMAHEVRNMILNAEMLLRSSLFRTESRGTHYREDYPQSKLRMRGFISIHPGSRQKFSVTAGKWQGYSLSVVPRCLMKKEIFARPLTKKKQN